MNYQESLLKAFEYHVVGNLTTAQKMYKEIVDADPNGLIVNALLNLITMQETFTRSTKSAGLCILRNSGFIPTTVLDVGAQVGTPPLYEVFPEAHHVMLEPVVEHEPTLKRICKALKSAECIIAAVTSRSGTVQLQVSENLQYASIGLHDHNSNDARVVEAISLNDLCSSRGYHGPFLVKIDVDGVEIEVLKGATTLISPENIFIVEGTLLGDDPQFSRIIDFFKPYGFVLNDIVDYLYRPTDKALWQVDMVMVHKNNILREKNSFS